MDEVVVPAHKRRKRKGKLDEDRMDFDTKIIEHTLSEDALAEHFPQGYKRLPDEVYKKLELTDSCGIRSTRTPYRSLQRQEWKNRKG